MKQIRDRFEQAFGRLGLQVYRHPYLTVAMVMALMVLLLLKLPTLTVDTSNDAFYHPDDPIRVAYNDFQQQFGKDDRIVIAIQPDEIFNSATLQQIRDLQQDLDRQVPHLSKTTSLLNARYTSSVDDELLVEDFIEQIPQLSQPLAELKNKAEANAFYQDFLLSSDGSFTFINIEPLATKLNDNNELQFISTREYREMMQAIEPILDEYRSEDFKLFVAGFPVITDRLTQAIEKTLVELTPLTILINLAFLFLLFRRFSGVVYPTLIAVMSIVSAVGIMTWLSIPLDLVTTIIPTLLSVVAIADSVHLLTTFYREHDRNGGDKEAAIAHAMSRNGLAILMTSVTTSAGLASFLVADLAPVYHLGIVAPAGIMLAFLFSVTLLPALLAIFPVKVKPAGQDASRFADGLLDWVTEFSCSHYKAILVGSAALLLVGITGAFQLQLSHNALTWLPEDSPVRHDTVVIDQVIGGAVPIEVIVDSGESGGIYEPELMQRLETSATIIDGLGTETIPIGNSNSVTTVIKEVNQALQDNDPLHYVIPDSRELIAQELLLFEISAADELFQLVDDEYSKLRFTIMLPFADAIQLKPVLDRVREHFQSNYADLDVTLTGIAPMLVGTMYDVITTMFKSYGFALITITVLMIIFIGTVRFGLLSMAPNLLPIILVMGMMGWVGIPFDFSNMLVGSVAIGLVVDDTIHFLHNLKRYLDISGDIKQAIRQTLHTAGRAIFITSLVIISGMAVAMNADLNSTVNFGLITACAIVMALLADFFLVPAIMMLLYRAKDKSQHAAFRAGRGNGE